MTIFCNFSAEHRRESRPGYGLLRRPALLIAALLLGLVAAVVTSVTYSPPTAAAQATPVPPPLRIGVSAMVTPVSAVRYYQDIVDYVAERLEMEGEMVHRTTYDEMDRLLEEKKVDVAFICSAPYVLDREKFGVELLVAPEVDGEAAYHSEFIVHRDSPIKSFADLRGRTFAFVDPKSNSGRLYPLFHLAREGVSPDDFFSRYFFSYSHNKSVEMVAMKKVDGAAVDSLVLRYMRVSGSPYAEQIRVVHRSPPFGIPPVVVPPGLPLYLKEKIREIFLEMHQDPRGREILASMQIDRFVTISDAAYDTIREMREFLAESKKLQAPEQESAAGQGLTVRFSVVPDDNPRISYEKHQPLLDYLQAKTGIAFELALKKTHQEVVTGLGNGEFHLALLDPLSYLDAHKRHGARPIAKSTTGDGSPFFQSVIVVGPKSNVRAINQLTGKKFAFTSIWSAAGNLLPRYMLAWEDIHLDKLQGYHNFDYHETVVKKVLSGEYDAGAVRRSVAAKYLPYGLQSIATSDPIPTGPVVAAPHAPYLMIQMVQEALFAMANDPEGRRVLALLDDELQGGFVPASDTDYSGIRKMINDVPNGCGLGCHPKVNF